jgi:hypothetical protein
MKTNSLKLALAGLLVAGASAHAVIYDLTTSTTVTVNGALFTTTLQQSTGTGVIDPFVRLVDSNGEAEGYNADARPVMTDVNTSPQFTKDILLSQVPLQTIGGIEYYEFLLDINQTKEQPLLSLDKIQIYTRAAALTSADELTDLTGAGSTLRYNLDAGGDNALLLNYELNNGSGSGDMLAYIPKSLFGAESEYVYLYSLFGQDPDGVPPYNGNENDGFEEWAIKERGTTTNVPEGGATVLLLGAALTALGAGRRFLKR